MYGPKAIVTEPPALAASRCKIGRKPRLSWTVESWSWQRVLGNVLLINSMSSMSAALAGLQKTHVRGRPTDANALPLYVGRVHRYDVRSLVRRHSA